MLVWYSATSEVPWLFLLAAWVFAFATAGAVYEAWNRSGLALQLRVTSSLPADTSPLVDLPSQILRTGPLPAPVFEGDAMEVEVGITTSGAPRGPAWLRGRLGAEKFEAGTALVPRAGWSKPVIVRELQRGSVDAASWVIGSSDPLGCFTSRLDCVDVEVAIVLPRFTSFTGFKQVRELEASLAAPRAGSGTELFGVREYTPGDPPRRIHWRSSARRGKLVLREYEPPGALTLGIFCDPAPANRQIADQIARIAASETWDCLRDGGRVMLWGPGLAQSLPSDARSFWSALEWLARYPTVSFGGDGDLPSVSEAVAIVGGASTSLDDAIDSCRRGGARTRAWVVGEGESLIDGPARRVGTDWPL